MKHTGHFQVAGYDYKLDANGIEVLNTIQMQAQKMERLIKDLLSFSRLGRQQIKSTEIDMGALVTTALDELKSLSDGRIIKFDIEILPPGYKGKYFLFWTMPGGTGHGI